MPDIDVVFVVARAVTDAFFDGAATEERADTVDGRVVTDAATRPLVSDNRGDAERLALSGMREDKTTEREDTRFGAVEMRD